MSEPHMQAPEGNAIDGAIHRVHHSYIWLGSLRVMFYVAIAILFSSSSSLVQLAMALPYLDDGAFVVFIVAAIIIAAIVVVFGIVVLMHWWSYRHLYYVLGPDELNVYKGIFNKQRVHVPYTKVQSVDQKASLLQRVAGVRTLYIDTAGGANNKAVIVPYLTKHDADWLRGELFKRKEAILHGERVAEGRDAASAAGLASEGNVLDVGRDAWEDLGGVFAGERYEAEASSFEYGLSNLELALAGLSNKTSFFAILFGLILALSQIVGLVFDASALDAPIDDLGALGSFANSAGSQLVQMGTLFLIIGVIVAVVVIWVFSVLHSCVNYGGFKARRRGARIEVEYGLLQHTVQGIDVDRVQAVVVSQSFIRRLFGYCQISISKVDATAGQDSSQQKKTASMGVIVHPFVKLAKAQSILEGLIPEFACEFDAAIPVAPIALRRALVRQCIIQNFGFWLALIVLAAQVALGSRLSATGMTVIELGDRYLVDGQSMLLVSCVVCYVFAALLIASAAINAVMWARSSNYALTDSFMQMVNGGFSIETTTIPRKKIQFGYVKTNPLQRHGKVATINTRTAAGIGGTTVRLMDVRSADADAWLAWLQPRVAKG